MNQRKAKLLRRFLVEKIMSKDALSFETKKVYRQLKKKYLLVPRPLRHDFLKGGL
jgi:hypothetical protein